MSEGAYDHLFKILLIGDSGVGKSSILLRFTDDEFNPKSLSTIGVDFKVKFMNLRGKRLKLAVWDTAGQERFRTLTSSYYRGAHAIILVYDCCVKESFNNLQTWLEEVRKYATNVDAVKMLVANKVDKAPAEVTREEGEAFAVDHSTLFIETSAKTRVGIAQAFEEVVQKILDTPELLHNTVPVGAGVAHRLDGSNANPQASGSGCCS
uniref:Ras-related protein Rab-18 n=1 Tax=Chromera velia CCMP2878 TaxID=1169474 RepID=A0A0G4FDH7_9ALVE|eukprot:Cvel_16477.t1-p1 / transcript=Cvel_16477.t1 / gene=Cvel_16477 / organism=Chromera_velia_CCMP2878 / gene_product=Ras-related protein Rab-18A, putative / transcript_product=Ras-related protein Rab-18A, putative / location=Cvel_scaffold1270:25212-28179(+) / protein_length=207 / sequence_SO=supercontig / SO=protein_coding / is_pseudo=false